MSTKKSLTGVYMFLVCLIEREMTIAHVPYVKFIIVAQWVAGTAAAFSLKAALSAASLNHLISFDR